MQFVRKPRRQPVINIISLIDILVVLLIFYIATTVFKKNEPKIDIVVPKSTQATTANSNALPSIIYVKENSNIFLDDTPVEPDKLGDLLKGKLAADPNFKVAMKADRKAPFSAIVQVLDAAHAANISNLPTFATPVPAPSGTGSPPGP
ncbi:MAG TPA: biopolymer transporter ExbD [Candidatus Methylacidiphilales bacterium]|nr:biopolymer transporter ExbD [Candidatus Methylacidiphilales bacterium]